MRIIKRLDSYILKNFLTLFAGTFFISLFVLMMQFLWKYVDELVGKGLQMDILAQFFFYAGVSLVPMAFPLAILLASLISFGNLGERFELLSIKAAGISLIRTLRPLIILMVLLAGVSFYFQDVIGPKAQMNLLQLRYSIMNKSPELEIPEGVFYDGIDRINLYVREKDKKTGVLHDVVIYNMMDGAYNAHIILADSASLETSADKQYLLLHLYSGEQFENMPAMALQTRNVPYRRETFVEKHLLIDFDTNFKMEDADFFSTAAMTKDIKRLAQDIDSMKVHADSIGQANYAEMKTGVLYVYRGEETSGGNAEEKKVDEGVKKENAKLLTDAAASEMTINIDTAYSKLSAAAKQNVLNSALQKIQMEQMAMDFNAGVIKDEDAQIRRHQKEFWTKFTLSLACVVFFFIGAPLGAIIRKGGLGLPVVVSVLIFISYYIIDSFGTKLGKEGSLPVWLGVWLSTMILTPLGIFLTVKSNNDSVVFNYDSYVALFRKLLGIPQKRHISRKEVIITDPDYPVLQNRLATLATECRQYRKSHKRLLQTQLIMLILKNRKDETIEHINTELESIVEELSNSKDRQLLLYLNAFPVLRTAPRFRNLLRKELRVVYKTCDKLVERIGQLNEM